MKFLEETKTNNMNSVCDDICIASREYALVMIDLPCLQLVLSCDVGN